MVVLQQAIESITIFDVQPDGFTESRGTHYAVEVITWTFGVAFLTGISLLTFLGAWLARKRGNEPSQATPESVRDDAV